MRCTSSSRCAGPSNSGSWLARFPVAAGLPQTRSPVTSEFLFLPCMPAVRPPSIPVVSWASASPLVADANRAGRGLHFRPCVRRESKKRRVKRRMEVDTKGGEARENSRGRGGGVETSVRKTEKKGETGGKGAEAIGGTERCEGRRERGGAFSSSFALPLAAPLIPACRWARSHCLWAFSRCPLFTLPFGPRRFLRFLFRPLPCASVCGNRVATSTLKNSRFFATR